MQKHQLKDIKEELDTRNDDKHLDIIKPKAILNIKPVHLQIDKY